MSRSLDFINSRAFYGDSPQPLEAILDHIGAFNGTSENAILSQILTALMASRLILWIKIKSRLGRPVLEFTRFIQTGFMEPQPGGYH